MPKKIKFYKKTRYIIFLIILLVGAVYAYYHFTQEELPEYDFVIAEMDDCITVCMGVLHMENVDVAAIEVKRH